MNKIPAVFNWSGGKDSCLALHHVLKEDLFDVKYLLTTVNGAFKRVSMHGVRTSLLTKQAKSLGFNLIQLELPEMVSMEVYETELGNQMNSFKNQGINHSIFGDIFLEDLKEYREKQLQKNNIKAIFPLWKKDSSALINEFISLGYKTIVVCAQAGLEDFCGRIIDQSFLDDLPKEIDPCGENGEFHTFVFDGPIFSGPIKFNIGEKVLRTYPNPTGSEIPTGYWFVDLFE
ncbi:MAG: diphthine--ammonia ligase [Bacteroidota bacterium]